MHKQAHKEDEEKFLQALLNGDRKKASAIAKNYDDSHDSIKLLYENIIKPALYRIGEMWEYNIISVAAEHLATSISEAIMNELYANVISEDRITKKVLLGCIENEYHQVGIKMIADVFEMHGIDTFFLGSNLPNSEFISYMDDVKPDLIAISLSIYSHTKELVKMIKTIRQKEENIPIIVGGQAFLHGGKEIINEYENISLINNIKELEDYITNFKYYGLQ